MVTIPHKTQIIDPKPLAAALAEAARAEGDTRSRRAAILGIVRDVHACGVAEIRRRHDAGVTGPRTARELSYLADRIIGALYDVAIRHLYRHAGRTDAERLSVIATGGYGRGELAPFSDLDLLFLHPHKPTAWHETIIEFILYTLWDMGLTVGQAVRSPAECLRLAKDDLSIRTNLLEMRRIAGDAPLYDDLARDFADKVVAGGGREFVAAKMAERDARHDRMGDSRYVVEPNLKDGKGGLRDLQTLFWLTRYLYGAHRPRDLIGQGILETDEVKDMRNAYRLLWTVRVSLHFLAGRAEERLTFDVQPELARRLGYADRPGLSGVERFMKHYFLTAKQVGDLTRVICAVLESRHVKQPLFSLQRLNPRRSVRGFRLDGGRLTIRKPGEFAGAPTRMITIFAVAHETGNDIHPDALRAMRRNLSLIGREVRRDPAANAAFMSVLTSKNRPEINLRRMNEAGVFGRFVPDFGRVVAQMQYDMYHHYTVDEHTINAIGLLAKIERGELEDDHPLSTEIVHKVVSRRALYVAVLLHDIAKGRGGDHSEIGARIARKLGPRLGLTPAETDLTAWLVRHHLLMSRYAFKRDLADRKTIQDFCAEVKSPERLKLLVVLTVVDIRAVGPGIWNGWKGQLLRDLYDQAEEVLIAGHAASGRESRTAAKQQDLAARLEDWPADARAAHMARFHDSYWIAEDADTLERNARLIRETEQAGEPVGIRAAVQSFQDMTEVSVFARDRPGLFAHIAGALAVSGASVVDAKIHTSTDGMALDNFRIQTEQGDAFDDPRRLKALDEAVRAAVRDELPAAERLRRRSGGVKRRTDVFTVEPLVLIDNRASNRATVVEVNARDRAALLYDLTRALSRLRLSVYSAHVATYGERAVDVFYLRDLDGYKVEDRKRMAALERALLRATRGSLPPKPIRRRKGAAGQSPVPAKQGAAEYTGR